MNTSTKSAMLGIVRLMPILPMLAFIGAASAQRPAEPSCAELEHSNSAQQMGYLEGDRATLAPECIEYALKHLGIEEYAPAINTLVRYLDFESPTLAKVNLAVSRSFDVTWIEHAYRYPARTALSHIGLPAANILVALIANTSSPDLIAENAAEALLDMHNDDRSRAVALLTSAAKTERDTRRADRLRAAARKMANACVGPELRSRCELALN